MKTEKFDIEKAKAGAKVVTRDGKKIAIISFSSDDELNPIIGYIEGCDTIWYWHSNGFYKTPTSEDNFDLFLVSKEEFKFKAGDKIYSRTNPDIKYKIVEVGITNEREEYDYRCEWIGEDSKYIKKGQKVLISSEKLESWAVLISEEQELTEFESTLAKYMYVGCDIEGMLDGDDGIVTETIKNAGKHLLDIARKELDIETKIINSYNRGLKQGKEIALKDLPKWKKFSCGIAGNCDRDVFLIRNDDGTYYTSQVLSSDCVYIELNELEKLPKEE